MVSSTLVSFSVGPTTFAASLKCSISDKGAKKQQLGYSEEMQPLPEINYGLLCSSHLSLLVWLQFSFIAENLTFNTN